MACLQCGLLEAAVKEVGSMEWISVSKARGVGAISGGTFLGLCILFLDRVIMGWEFGCSKIVAGGVFSGGSF
jgi:hypothetical protein